MKRRKLFDSQESLKKDPRTINSEKKAARCEDFTSVQMHVKMFI